MVACLEKTEGNSNFHEIVDFLASSSIHHALTVSPPIYTSYIEQFWNTASSQTANDVKQIDVTVDSKAVVVTEASIRSSLLFNDADALFSPQWKFLIHTILHCLCSKSTSWNEFSTNIALAVICPGQSRVDIAEGEGSENPLKLKPTASPTQPKGTNGNEGDQVQIPHDSPLSGGHTSDRAEGVLNLQELSVLCTNLSNRVLALESIKDAQAAEISALKSRIKKLEKKCKPSISHHRAWLKSMNRLSIKKRFGKKEFVSKQGRKKSKPESTLDDSIVFDDQDADHGIEYMKTEKAGIRREQSGETERFNVDQMISEVDWYNEYQHSKMKGKERKDRDRIKHLWTTLQVYIDEERSKLLAEFFERRKKLLAEERVAAMKRMMRKRNKKAAGIDEEEVPKELESTKVKVKQEEREENIKKRSGRRLKMKATKKYDEEVDDLKGAIQGQHERDSLKYRVPHDYYRVFRANGSSRYIKTFTEMVSRFDRLDFIELHGLVMQRFSKTTTKGIDLVHWGDLRIMFKETADDDIWKN
ncbi:hypothetical protein Tco_0940278 [Tanacetum coccineum]|uniref:Uncharacterized protein n=1 Tax=Tanacetum coccineum TaxID=301880 RepID=A0ABQ5DP92_9ASTR